MTRLLAEESIVRGRAGARHLLRVPFVRTLAENFRLRDLARLFVGDSAIPSARRVHLDDSNETNGPLRVLPATHTRGVLQHEEIQQLTTEVTQ